MISLEDLKAGVSILQLQALGYNKGLGEVATLLGSTESVPLVVESLKLLLEVEERKAPAGLIEQSKRQGVVMAYTTVLTALEEGAFS